jgi:hypothetical protein
VAGLLLVLAKGMRAAGLEHDVARLQRAAARVRRRGAGAVSPIEFRAAAARWETPEQRRQRLRDAVLAAGGDPVAWPNAELARHWLTAPRLGVEEPQLVGRDTFAALDGIGARAERYRAELENGRLAAPARGATPAATNHRGGIVRVNHHPNDSRRRHCRGHDHRPLNSAAARSRTRAAAQRAETRGAAAAALVGRVAAQTPHCAAEQVRSCASAHPRIWSPGREATGQACSRAAARVRICAGAQLRSCGLDGGWSR